MRLQSHCQPRLQMSKGLSGAGGPASSLIHGAVGRRPRFLRASLGTQLAFSRVSDEGEPRGRGRRGGEGRD